MLVKGASIKSIAATAGKLAGRTLVIPKGYAKSSGTAWEAEKGSFAWFLKETFWPVFKISAAGVLAASLLVFLAYRFVYRPIHAHLLLERGLEMVNEDRFRDGNTLFAEGYREWAFKEYYFEYAQKFIDKRQYQLAREKYEQLLAEYDDYLDAKGVRTERGKDKYFTRAAVEYAHFESVLLENFEEAERILNRLLAADMYNYAGLLEAGDNYIRWASYDEERFYDKYEKARESYGIAYGAYGAYGDRDEILFRFLDVFIHTDNRGEVLRLKDYFEASPKKAIDPVRYAELGGYLLDKDESVAEVRNILSRALQADKNIPDIHYQLARFYNARDEAQNERIALNNAIYLYGAAQPISRRGLWRLVDSYGRSAQMYVKEKAFLEAEGEFKKGIERYEDGVKKTLIKKDAVLGRLYHQMGDIYYYQSGDLEAAYSQFVKAEDSLVSDPGLYYKKGFIRYAQNDYSGALREFARTEESFPSSRNLLFALGNANYMRNNFSIAEGYYSFLTERLEADRRRVNEILPDNNVSDRALILNLVKACNNLGVILYKMGQRTGNRQNTSRAMVLWTNSTELFTDYNRERETFTRRDTRDLAYLNLRQILNPLPDYELQIYQQLPRDMNELIF
jgi:tetratricopeptide (TPR) repeat protein